MHNSDTGKPVDLLKSINIFSPLVQESWIALCRIVRKTNLTADVGMVWITRVGILGNYFLLGIGKGIKDSEGMCLLLCADRWDDCYFATEVEFYWDKATYGEPLKIPNEEQYIAYLKNLFP